MAEFCLDCVNHINELNLKPYQVKFFSGTDICEECGQEKKLVARFNLLGMIAVERHYRKLDKQRNSK